VDGRKVLNLCSEQLSRICQSPSAKGSGAGSDREVRRRTCGGTLHCRDPWFAYGAGRKTGPFKRVEATLSFQSGFNSNIATIPALVGKDDLIFSDELNHASIIDGCRLSGAPIIRFEHCNPASLEQKLKENYPAGSSRRALIITDGVFSWMEISLHCLLWSSWLKSTMP